MLGPVLSRRSAVLTVFVRSSRYSLRMRAATLSAAVTALHVAAVVAACRPYAEASGASTLSDAAPPPVEAGTTPDADAGEAKRCDADAPFTNKTRLVELASEMAEVTIRLSADELDGYIASSRSGQYRIYRVSRAKRSDPWSAPVLVL